MAKQMVPFPHQTELGLVAVQILAGYKIVYLAMEERTGKTLTALVACELGDCNNILVITKKSALPGWHETLAQWPHTKNYTVTNYHQVGKLKTSFDLVIIDEAHSYLSGFPKQSVMWKQVRRLTKGKPLIYLSATPYAQGHHQLYHQLALSDFSPFRNYKNAYDWHRAFGIPDIQYVSGRQFESYKLSKGEEVDQYVQGLFIKRTRAELGFEHEPKDILHYIELDAPAKATYNTLLKDRLVELRGQPLVCDTPMKLRTSLHMLEGGTAKLGNNRIVLNNVEKVKYIMDKFGDTPELVIMYNYIAEKEKLEAWFSEARILQATSYAEGVDLSMHEHLVVYSQDFSTAKHSQRRARQANSKRETPINVHFILVKGAVSEQVYTTVTKNKTNFIDSLFKKEELK